MATNHRAGQRLSPAPLLRSRSFPFPFFLPRPPTCYRAAGAVSSSHRSLCLAADRLLCRRAGDGVGRDRAVPLFPLPLSFLQSAEPRRVREREPSPPLLPLGRRRRSMRRCLPLRRPRVRLAVSALPSNGLAAVLFAPFGVGSSSHASACRCAAGSRGIGAAMTAALFAGGPKALSGELFVCFSLP